MAGREKQASPGPELKRATAPAPLPEEVTGTPTAEGGLPAGDNARPASMAELEQRAEAGDGNAACSLGEHYRTGDVVSQDLAVAFRWYSRGAELGDRCAQNNLGSMFLNGLGCEQDKAQAIHWYRKSAEQGNIVEYRAELEEMALPAASWRACISAGYTTGASALTRARR